MSGPLVGKVVRCDLGAGDPNVRLLFLVIAEETGNPKQKDPDGWVRLNMRKLAARIGCDVGTVPDVVVRAEKAGMQVDRPGPKRALGYKLPEHLLAGGQQIRGRPRPATASPSVGTTPTDLLAPRQQEYPSVPPVPPGGSLSPSSNPCLSSTSEEHRHGSTRPVARGVWGAGARPPTRSRPVEAIAPATLRPPVG
jgi:hypothetical protein